MFLTFEGEDEFDFDLVGECEDTKTFLTFAFVAFLVTGGGDLDGKRTCRMEECDDSLFSRTSFNGYVSESMATSMTLSTSGKVSLLVSLGVTKGLVVTLWWMPKKFMAEKCIRADPPKWLRCSFIQTKLIW